MAPIEDYVAKRLKAIQKRRNFNPGVGAIQVRDYPKLQREFGAFQELLKINEQLQLGVSVPYDPSGLDIRKTQELEEPVVFVYFLRRDAEPIWKIGFSSRLHQRTNSIQTSNATDVGIIHKLPCKDRKEAHDRERRLHRHFRKSKTRDRNHSSKGEWFRITPSEVLATVKRIKSEGWDWLKGGP